MMMVVMKIATKNLYLIVKIMMVKYPSAQTHVVMENTNPPLMKNVMMKTDQTTTAVIRIAK